MTSYYTGKSRVIGSTDVYSRKHIDREVDRLSRLHDLNKKKIRDLKGRLDRLEGLINALDKHWKGDLSSMVEEAG